MSDDALVIDLLRRNPVLMAVLDRAVTLDLPDCWVVAGAVYQTVWNVLDDRPPADEIKDYDLAYHDATDLSYEAEDAVIQRAAALFADLGVDVEVRNQARVHLWFEDHFGTPCAPHASTRAAIDRFPARMAAIGVRRRSDGLELYAPYGTDDLLSMVVRPNPGLVTRDVYERKVASWTERWPHLTVLPWPD